MNEKLKQRLVGAAVLVSLAVIFIPMLLDGGKRSTMPMFGSNIPDKPDYQFEPLDIPLQPVPPITEQRPVLIDKPEPPPKPTVDESPASEAKARTTAAEPKPESRPRAEPKPKPEPRPEPEPASPSSAHATAWVVQVGSFTRSDNALSLRDKLRSNGFTAFVEKVNNGGGTIFRVRVGPELKRENAERQMRQLKQKMKVNGIVMGYEG